MKLELEFTNGQVATAEVEEFNVSGDQNFFETLKSIKENNKHITLNENETGKVYKYEGKDLVSFKVIL